MIDAVLSAHMNPQTCGVAKFNQQLAQRLGVPMRQWKPLTADGKRPLLSLKFAEVRPMLSPQNVFFELFCHDEPQTLNEWDHVYSAQKVYAGNATIANRLRPLRPDVIEAFCPSTIDGNPHRGTYRVLVFGMAHKLNLPHFEKLKAHLDDEHPDYTIELSTAVHEGNPWDAALTESVAAMRGIFGPRLRVLGYLGDDALSKELREVDAVAAYYVPALRANNTSAWAALEAGKRLYTNTDEHSPALNVKAHSWDTLLELFRA